MNHVKAFVGGLMMPASMSENSNCVKTCTL